MDMEVKRKVVHIGMAGFALAVGRLEPGIISLLCGVAFLFNWLVLPKLTKGSLERETDKHRGFSIGILIYPAVLLLLSLVFFEQQIFMVIAWGAMAFGDGFAGVIGRALGGPRIPWQPEKGWIGFVAFVIFGTGLTWGLVSLLPESTHLGLSALVWLSFIAPAMVVAAWVESLKGLVDDNLSVPLAASSAAFLFYAMPNHAALPQQWPLGLGLVLVLIFGSIASKKIDVPGGLVGGLLAWLIFLGGGIGSLLLLFAFFVLGSVASHFKMKEKAQLGLAQENRGKRSVRHAISNGGIAGLCGLLAWLFPHHQPLFLLMLASSLAAATADTLSSELGVVYGKKFVNILTWRADTLGKDGVISLEGTILGMAGALLIALLFAFFQKDWYGCFWVCGAGVFGNAMDSVLGASLQRKGYMTNDSVNFANTALAAAFPLLILWF